MSSVTGCRSSRVPDSAKLDETLELTQAAIDLGADLALVITPYYSRPTQEGLFQWYSAVATTFPAMPIVVYNVPVRTAVDVAPETVARLRRAHDNIVGIKETTKDFEHFSRVFQLCGRDILMWSGIELLCLPLLALGGIGFVSAVANIAPTAVAHMYEAWTSGEQDEAPRSALRLAPARRPVVRGDEPSADQIRPGSRRSDRLAARPRATRGGHAPAASSRSTVWRSPAGRCCTHHSTGCHRPIEEIIDDRDRRPLDDETRGDPDDVASLHRRRAGRQRRRCDARRDRSGDATPCTRQWPRAAPPTSTGPSPPRERVHRERMAGAPRTAAFRHLRAIAAAIVARADRITEWEAYDTGLARLTGAWAGAPSRRANFRVLRRRVHVDARGRVPDRRPDRLRHPPPARRRRTDHAVERPVHAGDLEARAVPGRPGARWCSSRPNCRRCRRACSPRSWKRPALPPGVFNIVHGIGEAAGAAFVAHPDVPVISFTGETTTGQDDHEKRPPNTSRGCRWSSGASRRASSSPTPTSTRAVDSALFGVFSLNGERCTAGSRILVERSVYDEFVERLGERAAAIRVGDPPTSRHRGRRADLDRALRASDVVRRRRAAPRERGWSPVAIAPITCRSATTSPRRCSPTSTRRHADLPRRDLRSGRVRHPVRHRGRGRRPRQRHPVRARRVRVDQRPPTRPPLRAPRRSRHGVAELAQRPRPAHAVRRREGRAASAAKAASTASTSTPTRRSCTSRSATPTCPSSGRPSHDADARRTPRTSSGRRTSS